VDKKTSNAGGRKEGGTGKSERKFRGERTYGALKKGNILVNEELEKDRRVVGYKKRTKGK